jgi:pimeloyl-ACP methyl ester carboxylesterase
LIDKGHGPLVILVPGVQGRWEWMTPTVDALAVSNRVMSFSLGTQEPADGWFSGWLRTIDQLMDRAHERRAVLIGVSFGGVIAARYAARRPDRVKALVLASAPGPRWQPDRRQALYLHNPRLMLPLFAVRGCVRLAPEILAARPSWPLRLKLAVEYARRAVSARVSPRSMSHWIKAWLATNIESECAQIKAPTLVVTGEPHLDRVVPVAASRQYLRLIPDSRYAVLPDTGHVGVITKPFRFTEIVGRFLATVEEEAAARAAAEHAAAVAKWAGTGTVGRRPHHAP